MIVSLEQVVRCFYDHGVRFIIIGGWAAERRKQEPSS
jgi:predicted nucleotidyltransferase